MQLQVASGLALIAAAIALNGALDEDDPAFAVEGSHSPVGWSFKRATLAVTGTTIAASAVAVVVQTVFIILTRWGPHVYELGDGIHFCIQSVVRQALVALSLLCS